MPTKTNPDLRRVVSARRRRDNAERDLVILIRIARSGGATLQSIADAAGLTRARICQIVNERSSTDA